MSWAWVLKMDGPLPVKLLGGLPGTANGGVAYLPVNLDKGEYALFCFRPDAKGWHTPSTAWSMLMVN
jgi:hypothetical protein